MHLLVQPRGNAPGGAYEKVEGLEAFGELTDLEAGAPRDVDDGARDLARRIDEEPGHDVRDVAREQVLAQGPAGLLELDHLVARGDRARAHGVHVDVMPVELASHRAREADEPGLR